MSSQDACTTPSRAAQAHPARDAQCYHDCCDLSTLRVTNCTFSPHYRHFPPEIMQFVTRFRDRLQQDGSACKNPASRSEEHTSELQSRENIVCRLLLEKKNKNI